MSAYFLKHHREISLLYENYQLKKQLSALNGANIIPIRQSDYD